MPGSTFTSFDLVAPKSVESKQESHVLFLSNCLTLPLFSAITERYNSPEDETKAFLNLQHSGEMPIKEVCSVLVPPEDSILGANVTTAGKEDVLPKHPQQSRSERCRHVLLFFAFTSSAV